MLLVYSIYWQFYPNRNGGSSHSSHSLAYSVSGTTDSTTLTLLAGLEADNYSVRVYSRELATADIETYKKWYGVDHACPELLKESVYGLCELHREDIKKTRLVGNPGCYTTCSILGLAPLLANGLVETKNIIIDAKSGVTGAGRGLSIDYHFCECVDSMKAYKIATHRHTSEIEQELSLLAGEEIMLSFTPHLVPMKRGIYATEYANLKKPCKKEELIALYKEFYKNEPFVRVYDKGIPESNHVSGSNFVDIGLEVDERLGRVVVVSAIDNLVKGAAGQAVQNMNILFGLDETEGLLSAGYYM